eukprot:TRINITY_DN12739_c0_g1_i1.p2 TRINITY_DN12739_c0_g1~~TRINITY_DN12739_c0_g1_i1.p2  ORF type:complete len:55 (+),score=7.38 TRINITY_DN12739_c0_g1_i1:278-442(+)
MDMFLKEESLSFIRGRSVTEEDKLYDLLRWRNNSDGMFMVRYLCELSVWCAGDS